MISVWTPIALCRDVPAGVTRAVLLDGDELVIWRSEAGGPAHIWEDRCPHRGMRLSLGFVREGALNCLYHGWQYGGSGSCVRIPAHPDLTVPPTITATVFEAAESGGLVWVRRGGGDAALPELPPLRPLVSLAVDVDGLESDHVELGFEPGKLHLFWHRSAPGRIMLHAALEGEADLLGATGFVRRLRDDMEQGAAA
jgi:phenylpropionate dioxygenase-like ring-hydroxylating dioxygenase large terminal subunit